MATTALIQEKIWLDKSSYDRAERLHFERLAKVLPVKITDENSIIYNSSASNDFPIITDTTTIQKSKSKKVTFSKLFPQDINVIESTKNLKNSKKGKKKGDVCKSESIKINAYVIQKNEENDLTNNTSVAIKKSKAKEVKEKKNKADKKQRIVEEDKMSSQEPKDQLLIHQGQPSICSISPAGGSLANEVAKARQHIKQSLQCMDGIAALAGVSDSDLVSRVVFLEKENQDLRNIVQELRSLVTKTDSRIKELEGRVQSLEESPIAVPALQICPQKPTTKDDDDDEDVDLFMSDSDADDAEATKIREERLAAYAAKKTKKPALIAKSNIILDVKPWDDETDMKAMEAEVRKIQADGLLWGAAKLVPVAFKIQKLQISCVVEDDKVSVDWLTETIEEIEDYVQSVDIAAFNKV